MFIKLLLDGKVAIDMFVVEPAGVTDQLLVSVGEDVGQQVQLH